MYTKAPYYDSLLLFLTQLERVLKVNTNQIGFIFVSTETN